MHLVQDHEAVVARKPRVNRPHPWSHAVAAEQQAGAELVHGGDHDPGLIRAVRPLILDGNAASQRGDSQRLPAAQRSQTASDEFQNRGPARFDPIPDLLRPFVDLIDNDAPVDHEHDASGRDCRPGGQGEYGGIEHGGLAGAGREVDDLRPGSPAEYLRRQALLPGERWVVVDVPEECGEVIGRQILHHARRSTRVRRRFRVARIRFTHRYWPHGGRLIPPSAPGASIPAPGTVQSQASTARPRDARTSTTHAPVGA